MRFVDIAVIYDLVNPQECGNVGGIVYMQHPKRHRYDNFDAGPLLAIRRERPARRGGIAQPVVRPVLPGRDHPIQEDSNLT